MNLGDVRRVADGVLYEGYILYPYRASAQKNRSRWQFGVLMPPRYAAADPSETAMTRAECVFEHSGQPKVEVIVRFLQVQRRRTVGAAVDSSVWDEAVEREVPLTVESPALLGRDTATRFAVPGGSDCEARPNARVIRHRERLTGTVSVRAHRLPGPWQAARLTVQVTNETTAAAEPANRDQALPDALVAVHMIIGLSGGAFVSMTDPPEWASHAVGACENSRLLAGARRPEGSRQVMLAAPIILPDHPEVAPESPGELYDGTEIDEILTLRTLALSDEEKAEARATDPRAAALIDRVDSIDAATMGRLHGTIRSRHTPELGRPPARRRALVGSWRGRVRLARHRYRRGSRTSGGPRQPGGAAARRAPRGRAGHVPRRAGSDRRGGADRRRRHRLSGGVPRRRPRRGPALGSRPLPLLRARRG